MAVLVEGISVVIQAAAIHQKFPGGWEGFKSIVPNKTLCADNELVRVGFMTPSDVEAFISKLCDGGLEFLKDGEAIDIAVADQIRGLTSKCRWAEFGRVNIGGTKQEVSACRLVGSSEMQVVNPPEWEFEGSLSQTYGFVPTESVHKGMKYLRHENGVDVYFSPITEKEVYVGRTDK